MDELPRGMRPLQWSDEDRPVMGEHAEFDLLVCEVGYYAAQLWFDRYRIRMQDVKRRIADAMAALERL